MRGRTRKTRSGRDDEEEKGVGGTMRKTRSGREHEEDKEWEGG